MTAKQAMIVFILVMSWHWKVLSNSLWLWREKNGSLTHFVTCTIHSQLHKPWYFVTHDERYAICRKLPLTINIFYIRCNSSTLSLPQFFLSDPRLNFSKHTHHTVPMWWKSREFNPPCILVDFDSFARFNLKRIN